MRDVWKFLTKLKIELQYDPAIPLLGTYLEKMKTNSKRYLHPNGHSSSICNSQDKEAWKQPKCLLTRMDKEVVIYIYMCVCMYMYICIYNRILLSHKKE